MDAQHIIEQLPRQRDILDRLSAVKREERLLKKLLDIAKQRDATEEAQRKVEQGK